MVNDGIYNTIHNITDSGQSVIRKSIVIGIGGSGINGVLSSMSRIEKDIPVKHRRYIRWIGIDIPDCEDASESGQYRFPSDQFCRDGSRMLYLSSPPPSGLSAELLKDKITDDPCYDWLPDPDLYDMSSGPARCANRSRPLGRLAYFHNEDSIRRALTGELAALDVPAGSSGGRHPDSCDPELPVSVFLAASICGGTGSGMFLDIAALVKDIFKDYRSNPEIYGILLLPSSSSRSADSGIPGANAYAALKEIDSFMSGSRFSALYPSGRKIEINGSLFDDDKLYLLDVENMAGNSLFGYSRLTGLAGQFISAFITSIACSAVKDGATADKPQTSVYQPAGEISARKACYNSFGISRAYYPVTELKETGYRMMSVKIIDAYFQHVNGRLMSETLGDMSRGLAGVLCLDCRMIFDRMHPDYQADIDSVKSSLEARLKTASTGSDYQPVISLMKSISEEYGHTGLKRLKPELTSRMERRYRLELDKIKGILTAEITRYINDPERGFIFAGTAIDLLLDMIDLYRKKYYSERALLEWYSDKDLENLSDQAVNGETADIKLAEAAAEMAAFNYGQLVYETMLTSAGSFIRELRALMFNIKNTVINDLYWKVSSLRNELLKEVETLRFTMTETDNPFSRNLIDRREIDIFIEEHFYNRLSFEDLCGKVDFAGFAGETEADQLMESYLISSSGADILTMDAGDLEDQIDRLFGNVKDKPVEDIIEILFSGTAERGVPPGGGISCKAETANIKKNLFKLICSGFGDFSFNSISIRHVLDKKEIQLSNLLEKLDYFSRPYIYLDSNGLSSVEYCRIVTDFKLNADEDGAGADNYPLNDLPARMNHYTKRENAEPEIIVETFETPELCSPREIISIGILRGFPIFKINSIDECVSDYHRIISDKSLPLHLFNNPAFDAKYFPDPLRKMNYLHPAKLWSGLVLLKILEEKDGVYIYDEKLAPVLKDLEARENYKRVILELEKKILQQGGFEKISTGLLSEIVGGLGILAKNPADGRFQFRREYSAVITDITDGGLMVKRAAGDKTAGYNSVEKIITAPKFADEKELEVFLDGNSMVRNFIISSIKSVMERTGGNISAGADISLPSWKISQTVLPVFKDKTEFYDYYNRRGSLEWQNILMETLSERLDEYIASPKFRLENDPSLQDRAKIMEFIRTLDQKMPDVVLCDVAVKNCLV